MSDATNTPRRRWYGLATRRGRLFFLLSFGLACLVSLAFEEYSGHLVHAKDYRGIAAPTNLVDVAGLYQWIVGSGPRKLLPRFTSVLVLEPDDPGIGDACSQRARLAEVVTLLAQQRPTVIVVDKYFSARCEGDPRSTEALAAALEAARAVTTVVIGRLVEGSQDEKASSLPRLSSQVPAIGRAGVEQGIVNLDTDNRRAPLGWEVANPDPDKHAWTPSIAFAAASAYDPALQTDYPLIQELIADGESPYVSFLGPETYQRYALVRASQLLRAGRPYESPSHEDQQAVGKLAKRIVVVGEVSEVLDSHASVVGRVPGFMLQANYIEALLDQRYFRPAPAWIDYAIGFLVFFLLQLVVSGQHEAITGSSGWRRVAALLRGLGWIAFVVAGTLVGLYLVVVHVGWYINPIALATTAIAIKVSELLFLFAHRSGGHDESHAD